MVFMILAILVHLAAVWIVLEVVETRWPQLHRLVRAAIVSAIVAFLVALFRSWICGWLCGA